MVSQSIVVLLFASLFSCTFSMQESFARFFNPKFKPPEILRFAGDKTIRLDKYWQANELASLLRELEKEKTDIMKVVQIGKSAVDHTPIWAVEITKDVQKERELLKPMFKFVANVHGDETVGYALLVSLIQYLVYKYDDKEETSVKKILDEIDVWIIPTLNPDGLSRAKEGTCESNLDGRGRYNGNGKNIDEDFAYDSNSKKMKPETIAMVNFLLKHPFVLSGSLWGGDIVASSPPIIGHLLETYKHGVLYYGEPSVEADSAFFENLAFEYSEKNLMMRDENPCGNRHPKGFTNYWKSTKIHRYNKVMQDFNYVDTNCFELKLELSCCKYPLQKYLPYYWQANLNAMLNFIMSTRRGVYGLVLDTQGNPVKTAVIHVWGMEKNISVTDDGEYWRLLGDGWYHISAIAPGYEINSHHKHIPAENPYVQHNFVLKTTLKKSPISKYLSTLKNKSLCAEF